MSAAGVISGLLIVLLVTGLVGMVAFIVATLMGDG